MGTPRGERRRAALVEAAADLLRTGGFDAVRHRAVADRADVPLGATTYYFSSRDELVEAGLRHLAGRQVARSRALLTQLPEALTRPTDLAIAIVGLALGETDPDTDDLLLLYESLSRAARQPALQPLVKGWNSSLTMLISDVLRRGGCPDDAQLARTLLAATDGLLLGALVEGEPDPAGVAAAGLARVLTALRA